MIYLIRMRGTNYIKIGIAESPKKRLSTLASGNPIPLELIYEVKTNNMHVFYQDSIIETEIHAELAAYHIRGEWFELNEEQVGSIIHELTERFRERVIWNRWLQQRPPANYIEGQEHYYNQPLLARA